MYGSTREQLLRAAQRTLGVDVVRSLTVAGLRPVGRPTAAGAGAPHAKRASAGDAAGAGTGAGKAGKRRRQSTEAATEALETGERHAE